MTNEYPHIWKGSRCVVLAGHNADPKTAKILYEGKVTEKRPNEQQHYIRLEDGRKFDTIRKTLDGEPATMVPWTEDLGWRYRVDLIKGRIGHILDDLPSDKRRALLGRAKRLVEELQDLAKTLAAKN